MSDDDWEKPDFAPSKPASKAVKDSWDGEDEDPEPAPPAKSAAAAANTPLAAAAVDEAKVAAVEKSIDRLNPVTMPEFEKLRDNVEAKLAPLSSSPYYDGFVEELIRDLCTGRRVVALV